MKIFGLITLSVFYWIRPARGAIVIAPAAPGNVPNGPCLAVTPGANANATFGMVTRNSIDPGDCYQFCNLSAQTTTYPWYFSEAFITNVVLGESVCTCYTSAFATSADAAVGSNVCVAGYGVLGFSEFVWEVTGP